MNGDPAVEAAERSSNRLDWHVPTEQQRALLVVGAREALKPLQEWHKPIWHRGLRTCMTCRGVDTHWPCETARLVYSAEELL
jgi:hypothetical protein